MVTHKVSIIQPLPVSYQEPHRDGPRGQGGDPRQLVRRHLPGPEELLPADGGGRDDLPRPLPRVRPAGGAEEGLAGGPHRRHRRAGDGRPVRLEGRRPASPSGGALATARTAARNWEFNLVGIYDGAQKGTDTSGFFFHYDYLKEAIASGSIANQVGWYIIRIADPARSAGRGEADRRPVRQLAGRDQDPDREGDGPVVRQPGGQHRRPGHLDRGGGLLHPAAGGRPTPWRSRSASGRASWRCSRPWASPTSRCCCWCSPSRAPWRCSARPWGWARRSPWCRGSARRCNSSSPSSTCRRGTSRWGSRSPCCSGS